MEKRKPTYDLDAIKSTFATIEDLNATVSARRGAVALRMGPEDIVDVIQGMERRHFRKSMTSYVDYRVWQDVYIVPSVHGPLYVKIGLDDVGDLLVLSFKEGGDD